MRPQILYPLFTDVGGLSGIGQKTARSIAKLAGPRLVDLLWHLPTGLVDRRTIAAVASIRQGDLVTLVVTVDGHQPGSGRRPYRVRCHDDSGGLDLVYFHGKTDWLMRTLPVGERRVVSGRADRFQEMVQMVHPDHIAPVEELEQVASVEPQYPLTAGLTPKTLRRTIEAALAAAPPLPEWIDAGLLKARGWPDWQTAIRQSHQPQAGMDLEATAPARARLAYDELLANQTALAVVRNAWRRRPGRPTSGDGRLTEPVRSALPFALTGAQSTALAEIRGDMASAFRMLRLLQGDVGSGKTVVALLAMLSAVETGAQAVLLAPTEILARQHFATITRLLEPVPVRVDILTGRDKGRGRAEILKRIAEGDTALAVGTHALLQEDVAFRDLAFAVIDEQHRFGVDQRLAISVKGTAVDILVMTATPIPRTLQLTAYGDMDVSRLMEKPPGRRPVDTRTVSLDRLDDVLAAVGRKLSEGAKIFWVCPLVDESEDLDLATARERHEVLGQHFGERVGLVHGRMKAGERDAAIAAFARDEGDLTGRRVDILVATTVIEVGVDVPAANVLIVEHAERFGLAQLHQLRGRIGRGTADSVCILLYQPPLGEVAKARLKTLRQTEDGFAIAEEDLRLRGAGEVLGTRQSGLPKLRLADLAQHADLIAAARDDALLALSRDPDLAQDRGKALRVLLYLFERDAAVRYLRSG